MMDFFGIHAEVLEALQDHWSNDLKLDWHEMRAALKQRERAQAQIDSAEQAYKVAAERFARKWSECLVEDIDSEIEIYKDKLESLEFENETLQEQLDAALNNG